MATQIASLYAKVGADTTDFHRNMSGVESTLNGVGSTFTNIFKIGAVAAIGATTAAIGGLTAVIVKSTSAAADMEQQVANIAAVMQLTGTQTAQVSDLIKQLGMDAKLKVTATEAGQAIEMLAKNGLTLEQIMGGAARATVFLSNATGGTFADSADIATSAMLQFGLKAEDMAGAVNQMVGVTNASKFGIEDYGLAIAQAGGVAASVGVSFDDFNAVIAATSNTFASGSDAGTSFKTFLQRLVPGSKSAKEAMKQLGIITKDGANQFFDSTGKMKDMVDIVAVLNQAFSGLSEEQKNAMATDIFGTDAMRTAFSLANMTAGSFQKMKDTIGATDAEESATTRMDTLSGKWETFMGIIETLSISIGEKFLPHLKMITLWLTDVADRYGPAVVDWFGQLANTFGEVSRALMGAFDSAGLSGVMQQLWAWAGDLWRWFGDILNQYIKPKLLEWGGAFLSWAGSLWGSWVMPQMGKFLGSLIGWITSPETWGKIGRFLGSTWTMFAAWAGNVWAGMQPALADMGSKMNAWINENTPNLSTWRDAFTTFVGDVKESWSVAWPEIVKYYTDAYSAPGGIKENTDRIMENLNTIANWFAAGGAGAEMANRGIPSLTGIMVGFGMIVTDALTVAAKAAADLSTELVYAGQLFQAIQRQDWAAVWAIQKLTEEFRSTEQGYYNLDNANKYFENLDKTLLERFPQRASGGPVAGGSTYLVGEQGPELFTPSSSGYITPNGGGGRFDVYVHGDSNLPNDRMKLRELARALQQEISFTGAVMVQ